MLRPTIRPAAALAALLLLASCKAPEIRVLATFGAGGAIQLTAADPGDADIRMCWKSIAIVDDRAEPAWEIAASGLGECARLLPLHYGRTPAGASVRTPPRPIEPGRLYLVEGGGSDGRLEGAFSLSRDGDSVSLRNIDPGSAAAAELRRRWAARRDGVAQKP